MSGAEQEPVRVDVTCSICGGGCYLDTATANWTCDDHGYQRRATDDELSAALASADGAEVGPGGEPWPV